MGSTLKDLGKLEEAASCFKKSIEINPDFSKAYSNLGNVLRDKGYYPEAISFYQKALQLTPENAEANLNFGITLSDQGRSAEAITCFQKAIQQKPDFAEANNHLGVSLWNQGKIDEAVFHLKRAIQIKPDYTEAYGHLVHLLQFICDWRQLNDLSKKFDELTSKALNKDNILSEPPFICLARYPSLTRNFNVAKAWSQCLFQSVSNYGPTFSFDGRRVSSKKIKVGYLSCDFYDHATAHLMRKLFSLHTRDEFIIYCYSYGPDDGSMYREKIKQDCDKFIDIRELSFMDAARRIFEDEVDILVDLKGHTKGGRLSICAFRPAPIQVHYLGFPGTTGAEFIDYIITDRIVASEGHEPYYSEKLVCLPHCYQVNDHEQVISDRIWEKEELHLPEDSFVFFSNQSYKIESFMFDSWMHILHHIPKSVLWLLDVGETIRNNLRLEAHSKGINPDQLVFAEKLPKAEHLSRLVHAQLALDTRIVNGHTTTSDALWAGVPVIALQGSHFASRVSSSLLNSIGLSELITHHLEEYEKLAIRLAGTPLELKAIRNKLFQNRFTDPLFDTPRFTKNLEKAYKKMWNIFLEERKPEQIAVLKV
jgi:protein O-GlcNAc transferase